MRRNLASVSVNDFICLILRAAVHRAERGGRDLPSTGAVSVPIRAPAVREAKEAAHTAHKADIEELASKNEILQQVTDLALLAKGLLNGKALSDFIARSQKVVSDAYLK